MKITQKSKGINKSHPILIMIRLFRFKKERVKDVSCFRE